MKVDHSSVSIPIKEPLLSIRRYNVDGTINVSIPIKEPLLFEQEVV